MPAALQTLINETVQRFGWTRDEQEMQRGYFYNAGTYLIAGDMASAGAMLRYAADMFYSIWQWQDSYYAAAAYKITAALYWINTNWPTAAAVTMDAILSAMLGAKFSQLERFIGLEDAYRVALWNAPFNADFYAALARGFMKW